MNVVIFAGGVGSRLWPLSRKNSPKQFEKIIGDKSTLQLAAHRLLPEFDWKDMYVSTGKRYVHTVQEQLSELPKDHVIGEPQMRDVGPAVGLMTGILQRNAPDEPMVILWSDHLVKKEEHFKKILLAAESVIKKDPNKIIFVAEKPRFASENLGWIHYDKSVLERDGINFHEFKGFKYRPDKATADQYFASGKHAWNLGYFVTTPRFLWGLYKTFAPDVYEGLEKIVSHWNTPKFDKVLDEVYPTLEKIHFDNAILERFNHEDAYVIAEEIDWSDIGAWEALKEALAETDDENVTKGKVMLHDSRDSLIFNYNEQMVVGIDLDQMLVVNTGDVVLVCPKSSVPKIKKLVESLAGTEHETLA